MDDWGKAGKILLNGGIAVLPTDTIYGIHCLATNKGAVERIYDLKGRDRAKPFIILISSLDDLKSYGVTVDKKLSELLANYWPGPNSIILPVTASRFAYLHRGTKSLAFRLPAYKPLLTLLTQTGPLVSTSANPSSKTPASDIKQSQAYFGKSVDFYLDAGVLNNLPSRVFKLDMNQLIPVR